MYDVYDLVKSKELLEAGQHLKKIDIAFSSDTENRSAICKRLARALTEWTTFERIHDAFMGEKKKYYIVPAQKSMPYYLVSCGLTLGKVREVRKRITDLIAYIDDSVVEPIGNHLTIEKEENILSLLTGKYPFWDVVSSDPLNILNINNTNRFYNSTCGISGEGTPSVINMFNMMDNEIAPEYVFLHELGHVLQASITKSTLLVPIEFLQFHNSIPNTVKLDQENPDAAEVFADTFAVSVMLGTELSRYDPFHFPENLNEAIELFYKKLFEKYSRA